MAEMNVDNTDEIEVIILEDECGAEHRFVIGEIIDVGERQYAVLLPIDEDLEEGVVFRVEDAEDGEYLLTDIESDEEWNAVMEVIDSLYDEVAEEAL